VVVVPGELDKKSPAFNSSNSIKLLPFEKKTINVEYIPGSIDSIEKA
jgi:hypothetical protein